MDHHHKPDDDLEPDEGELEEEEQDEPILQMHSGDDPGFFQQQMHLENRRDIRRLQSGHSKMLSALARIEANTRDLPKVRERVDAIEEERDKVKGAMWIIGALGLSGPLTLIAKKIFKF